MELSIYKVDKMGDSHNLIELISESDISAKVKKMGLDISSFYEASLWFCSYFKWGNYICC